MKALTVIGIILILLGIAGFIFGGISFTKKSKVADLGPVEIQTEKKETVPVTPIASGVAVVAGIIMVVVGARKS
ncbi:MAG: DUF3185 domain-containing protein [Ignavibacteria bacterium]|jgi:UDP-N-acetylmuramyl pentapeptide phosphotransferase/UDP-N-acetylglucosamine-1-phosphate transferase|nr:DUF3185 domain-containing protein [Ignavibacteria bacterium]MCU7504199.1 DUF3185 domain-containing protein [Ignavibacteria bacterium]MCU7518124.1 DUF3185 domain-containing protein [Ignavibacteria bacterium]